MRLRASFFFPRKRIPPNSEANLAESLNFSDAESNFESLAFQVRIKSVAFLRENYFVCENFSCKKFLSEQTSFGTNFSVRIPLERSPPERRQSEDFQSEVFIWLIQFSLLNGSNFSFRTSKLEVPRSLPSIRPPNPPLRQSSFLPAYQLRFAMREVIPDA